MTGAFDLCGPLPEGVTVLEASAGTGKTFTIAALAARYVAEGRPLRDLLIVTFTRMATGELRERVRERLVESERGLATGAAQDEVVRLQARGSAVEVAERRERLARALADFDAATITTTHGFCQEVLGGLGVAADAERDAVFMEDVSDLLEEVVDDLYVRRFRAETTPLIDRRQARRIAQAAVDNPGAPVEPAGEDGLPGMRRRLVVAVRDELEARKRRAGLMTYDDLLTRLAATLEGPDGKTAARRLAQRYPIVLVDEFQDTDPIQWEILRRAFARGTLVLIGDPKQAIYAFRGADVYAYLAAARTAGAQATLTVNRRSDQHLLDAYDALFGGAQLGHPGIVYRRVRAAHPGSRLPGAALRVRIVPRDAVDRTPQGYAQKPSSRAHIAKDVAADIVGLLDEGEVQPGDVAVLVRQNRAAAAIRDELERTEVPAVVSGAGSVFATAAATEWLRLLEALERPAYARRAHGAAITPFLGWPAQRIAAAGDDAWEEVHRRLHAWTRVLRERGVASLLEAITLTEGLPARVLAQDDGERRMTDLRHVGQLLHAAATTEQLGATALAGWLRRRIADAPRDTGDQERSRRLESDAAAVQVLTIHRSKGLEFPVVYLPDLWEAGWERKGEPVAYHDPAAGDRRTIDVGLEGPAYRAHCRQHLVEQRGEELRLAYVALTRGRHRAVLWWAGSYDARHSPLGRLLFARAADGAVAPDGQATPTDAEAHARFTALAAEAPGCVAVERCELGPPIAWSAPAADAGKLVAARFDRRLDRGWRRTSFSDLTAGAHEARVASEPEEPEVTDEPPAEAPPVPAPPEADDANLPASPVPLAGMPAGVRVGAFVHRVLEATDFGAPDLDAELAGHLRGPGALDLGQGAAAGLRAAIETPLGPVLDGIRLRDVARADRLDELAFELPLAGGDDPTGHVTLAALADVLHAHGDPLAARLEDPALRPSVRGYLTGTIDLVVRLPGERFAIADYKTNWLGVPGEDLTAWHYRPHALAVEMERAHYGLQALLYIVALHRYLRWRLPGYEPDRNLAGVAYLFLRGMTGEPGGVYAWRPAGALVAALSEVLDRGTAA